MGSSSPGCRVFQVPRVYLARRRDCPRWRGDVCQPFLPFESPVGGQLSGPGHSSVGFTLTVYGHLMLGAQAEATGKLATMLENGHREALPAAG